MENHLHLSVCLRLSCYWGNKVTRLKLYSKAIMKWKSQLTIRLSKHLMNNESISIELLGQHQTHHAVILKILFWLEQCLPNRRVKEQRNHELRMKMLDASNKYLEPSNYFKQKKEMLMLIEVVIHSHLVDSQRLWKLLIWRSDCHLIIMDDRQLPSNHYCSLFSDVVNLCWYSNNYTHWIINIGDVYKSRWYRLAIAFKFNSFVMFSCCFIRYFILFFNDKQ